MLKSNRVRIVYFVTSACSGTCRHCWSADTYFGRSMPLEWHKEFWRQVDPVRIEEVRLSGGETFLYDQLGDLIAVIREHIGEAIPIRIFTAGKEVVSLKKGSTGVAETLANLEKHGVLQANVEIQLSCDEYHMESLWKWAGRTMPGVRSQHRDQYSLSRTLVENFLAAGRRICEQNPKFGGVGLKIHAGHGRGDFHKELFSWLDEATWANQVLLTTGLIRAGAAKKDSNCDVLLRTVDFSLFILPGVVARWKRGNGKCDVYHSPEYEVPVYLEPSTPNSPGVSVLGWYHLVNKLFVGGEALDFFRL